jgi:hypothetical protein
MDQVFQPNGCATLIGSQPIRDHVEATRLVLTHTPEIPTWVQLSVYSQEGMVPQFAAGLPGLVHEGQKLCADPDGPDFDDQLVAFFEEYLSVSEQQGDWDSSRFVLSPDTAQGFFTLIEQLETSSIDLRAVKGQITGPITFCTSLKDRQDRPIFYHDALRDAAVKLIALKAGWQVTQLRRFGVPVIIFIDEPALAGYGSSEFISISQQDIAACLQEVITTIHNQGALAGVHVCANTDWSLLLNSSLDVINFDANGYFDKFMLYADGIQRFLQSGRILAWGLVPTLDMDKIEAASVDSLWQDWQTKSQAICDLGLSRDTLVRQSIISPSCGTGPLPPALSLKVISLTQALSRRVRGA